MKRFVIGLLFVLGTGQLMAQQDFNSSISTANGEAGNIGYIAYQSGSISTTAQGQKVWSFTVKDSASGDGLPTLIVRMIVKPGGSNQALWSTTIREAALFVGSSKKGETVGAITNSQFTLENTGDYIAPEFPVTLIPDGGSVTFDLYVTFHSVVTDNQQLQFTITDADISQDDYGDLGGGFTSGCGSFTATSSVSSGKNKINVVADRLEFENAFNTVFPATNFSTQVNAADILGNHDLAATGNVTLSRGAGAGTLSAGSGLTKAISSGSATWSDLQLNAQERVTIKATHSGAFTFVESDTFLVSNALFIEDFEYANGANLDLSGWTQLGATSSPPVITTGASLTKSPYMEAGLGVGAAIATTAGEAVYRDFTVGSNDFTYYALLVRVTGATTSGAFFAGVSTATPTDTSNARACLYVKKNGSNVLAFGVSNGSHASYGPTYTSFSYSLNSTYLLVVKYTRNPGFNDNVVSLFVNPDLLGVEPSPTVTATTPPSNLDIASIGAFILRQDANGPQCDVDAIRVTENWNDTALPVTLASLSASASRSGAKIVWSTKSEVNNAGWEVERRGIANGKLSISNWVKVGFVAGAGTSASPKEYSFTDNGLNAGRYVYRLRQIDRNGSFSYSQEAEVEVGVVAKEFRLGEAYPNPFNPTTAVEFSLATPGMASVKVYNLLGQEVATLFNAAAEAGRLYRATWDASSMPSGIYFVRLESGSAAGMKRLMLVK